MFDIYITFISVCGFCHGLGKNRAEKSFFLETPVKKRNIKPVSV